MAISQDPSATTDSVPPYPDEALIPHSSPRATYPLEFLNPEGALYRVEGTTLHQRPDRWHDNASPAFTNRLDRPAPPPPICVTWIWELEEGFSDSAPGCIRFTQSRNFSCSQRRIRRTNEGFSTEEGSFHRPCNRRLQCP